MDMAVRDMFRISAVAVVFAGMTHVRGSELSTKLRGFLQLILPEPNPSYLLPIQDRNL